MGKWKAGGKWEEEIRVGQKGGEKRSVKEGEKKGRKKRVIGKKWAIPGTEPITGLKDREGKEKKKDEEKKKKKKDEEKM